MRLHLILPEVDPAALPMPTHCADPSCPSTRFRLHQPVGKAVRDTVHRQVTAQRYQCLRCGRTFRVYPRGITRAQSSQRVQGLAIMLYLLGLSYGAVALALAGLGIPLCKSRVYDLVQVAAARVPGLKRNQVAAELRTPALGSDVTSVKCHGQWLLLGLTVDDLHGLVLTVDPLPGEDADELQTWLAPIATAVGAQLLVTDDADAFKRVAENLGLDQQVCKSHVKRNTEALIEALKVALAEESAGSLQAIGVTPAQASLDLDQLGALIGTRRPEDVTVLEGLYARYALAAAPRAGERATVAYRLRQLFLDRWNLWPALTRYRLWRGPHGETVDGTNNHCERGIGWWIKERYRTMRGYKRPLSAVNVSRLLAWSGNQLHTGGADLAALLA